MDYTNPIYNNINLETSTIGNYYVPPSTCNGYITHFNTRYDFNNREQSCSMCGNRKVNCYKQLGFSPSISDTSRDIQNFNRHSLYTNKNTSYLVSNKKTPLQCKHGYLLTNYTSKGVPICNYDLNSSNCKTSGLIFSQKGISSNNELDLTTFAICRNDFDKSICNNLYVGITRNGVMKLLNILSNDINVIMMKITSDKKRHANFIAATNAGGLKLQDYLKYNEPVLYKKRITVEYLSKLLFANNLESTNKLLAKLGYKKYPVCI